MLYWLLWMVVALAGFKPFVSEHFLCLKLRPSSLWAIGCFWAVRCHCAIHYVYLSLYSSLFYLSSILHTVMHCHIGGTLYPSHSVRFNWLFTSSSVTNVKLNLLSLALSVTVSCRLGVQPLKPAVTQALGQSDRSIGEEEAEGPAQHPRTAHSVSFSYTNVTLTVARMLRRWKAVFTVCHFLLRDSFYHNFRLYRTAERKKNYHCLTLIWCC